MHSLRASVPFLLFAAFALFANTSDVRDSSRQYPKSASPDIALDDPAPKSSGDQVDDKRNPATKKPTKVTRIVRVTAYNAVPEQTDSTPEICAWGDRVRPGIIAISRDLEAIGLTRGKEVHIEGHGKVVVLDRMHYRKRNQIDILMTSYEDAIEFGVQERVISWVEEG